MGKRIVITSWGSYGDVNPYVALALGLRARGHDAVLAVPEYYRGYVEREGIGFHPVRPDVDPRRRDLARRIMEPFRGTEILVREILMPGLADAYADLEEAAEGADLLVTHPVTFAAPLLAEKRGIPWVATVLAPMSFFSAHDLPVLPPAPCMVHLRRLGRPVSAGLVRLAKAAARRWTRPVEALRADLGLPPRPDPLFDGQFSPGLVLGLFSRVLGEPQPDWPPGAIVTGHLFHDAPPEGPRRSPELSAFLSGGPAPVVFTLGSAAVMAAGDFFRESIDAARRLDVRALLLVGSDPANLPPGPLPKGIFAAEFAPHSDVFPAAAAVVHQGGIGTTGQALRSGRPQLVVPFAHDQPDNAFRVASLGVSRTLRAGRYRADRVVRELGALLEDPGYAERAAAVGRTVRAEDGVGAACDALEARIAREDPRERGSGPYDAVGRE